jgi:excisionase family DNA binding protein
MTIHDLVDVREATRITGLDKASVYRLARQGRLRSFKVLGRSLRFDRSDLLGLVEEKPTHTEKVVGASSSR